MKKHLFYFGIQFFANSIERAVKYIKEPAELEATLKRGLKTSDLLETNMIFTGTNQVKYQHLSFGSDTLGSYSTADGYTAMDINSEWRTLTLVQDKGNKIFFDKITEDEEVAAVGMVTKVNRYILDVQAPEVDRYRFQIIDKDAGSFGNAVLTSSTVVAAVTEAFAELQENFVDTTGLLLYMTPATNALLRQATHGQGRFAQGEWNNVSQTEVEMFDGAKVMVVPSNRLGSGIDFILLHKSAAPAFEKYQESVYFTEIPGHGSRRTQADIGLYHDMFVYERLVPAIYIYRGWTATATQTITPSDTNEITIVTTTANVSDLADAYVVDAYIEIDKLIPATTRITITGLDGSPGHYTVPTGGKRVIWLSDIVKGQNPSAVTRPKLKSSTSPKTYIATVSQLPTAMTVNLKVTVVTSRAADLETTNEATKPMTNIIRMSTSKLEVSLTE